MKRSLVSVTGVFLMGLTYTASVHATRSGCDSHFTRDNSVSANQGWAGCVRPLIAEHLVNGNLSERNNETLIHLGKIQRQMRLSLDPRDYFNSTADSNWVPTGKYFFTAKDEMDEVYAGTVNVDFNITSKKIKTSKTGPVKTEYTYHCRVHEMESSLEVKDSEGDIVIRANSESIPHQGGHCE